MKKAYVIGGAQTDFSRNFKKEGKNEISLLSEVINDSFVNANITFEDIKRLNKENKVACFVGNFIAEQFVKQGHLGALLTEVDSAFYGVPSSRYEAACASGAAALDAAITKIQAGVYDVAVVVGWELMKTVDSKTCGDFLGMAALYKQESEGVDYPFPNLFSKLVNEQLTKYKYDEDRFMNALGLISNKNLLNAKRNPNAQTRKWDFTLENIKNRGNEINPLIGDKLAKYDCSQISDGAAVVILASENFVKNLGKEFPYVKGFGHRNAPMLLEKKFKEAQNSEYILPWTRQAVLDAYLRANLTVDDINVFEIHDCFTSSEFSMISALGIAKPGEEIDAIEKGLTNFDNKYPVNPSGGLIGVGHPVGASGVRMFLDLYKQLTNQAGEYQIKNAKNGLMLNIGGTATTNYVFIVGL